MSSKLAPPPVCRWFYRSHPRFLLRVVAVALAWTLTWHLFKTRNLYHDVNQTSHSSTVDENAPPPAPPVTEITQLSTPTTATEAAPIITPDSPSEGFQLPCQSLQGLQEIFLVVRTGASEALEKLPVHFNTTLRCLPRESYGIWSDLEETIDGNHVGNALDEVSPNVIANHPDFDYYRRLQINGRTAFSPEEIAAWASAPNSASGRNTPGWKLDKWKFLPLAKKAYRQRPDAKWFIFTECDGYINWTSLLSWLSRHSQSRPYVGQLMIIGDVVFAYGGASFVISNQAMKAVVERYTAKTDFYEDFTGHHWAGDCVLGKALKDAGSEFSQAWPTFSGDSVFDMNFKSSVSGPDPHLWCYNAMTWHHMSPSDIRELSAFEERWNLEVSSANSDLLGVVCQTNFHKQSTLLRHSDVFRHFVVPRLKPLLEDWDNLSSDEESSDSLDGCHDICYNRTSCVQFAFHHHSKTCKISTTVKLGHQKQRHSDVMQKERITSGWMMDRVEAFMEEMDASCHGDGWVLS